MKLLTGAYCLSILFCLLCTGLKAQHLSGDAIADSAYGVALKYYHSYLAPEPALFRGPEYLVYSHLLKSGHPYFSDSVRTGTIRYAGIVYRDQRLLFDEVYGQVVIGDPYGGFRIALLSERIDSFTVEDHSFIRMTDSLNPSAPAVGFYEQLYRGRISLLKREKKVMLEDASIVEEGVRRYIATTVSYYIRNGRTYYAVNTTRGLMAAMKDRGREVKRFIRSHRLSMRKDKENTLIQVAAWYGGLNHQ
ncbi:MAG: hypothetical protein JST42_00180 [Bacteroidetes bacterium]|nr:hypothetical protein [Bacteroidota bacterium]